MPIYLDEDMRAGNIIRTQNGPPETQRAMPILSHSLISYQSKSLGLENKFQGALDLASAGCAVVLADLRL